MNDSFNPDYNVSILIASSIDENRELLKNIISEIGYSPDFSENVFDTFEYIREHEPDVVILDSKIDGDESNLSICRTIKDDPILQATQVLLITNENSRKEILNSIQSRADEYFALNYRPDEISARLLKVLRNRDIYRKLQNINEKFQDMFLEINRLNQEKEEDLKAGKVFQSSLMPGSRETRDNFKDLDIEVSMFHESFPGAEVTGDFWDVYAFKSDCMGFLLADAVGHGMPAAFYSMYTLSSLRRIITVDSTDCFGKLGLELYNIMDGKHLSACYTKFESNSLRFCNAGISEPVLIRDGTAKLIEHYGPILGAFPIQAKYDEITLPFNSGDTYIVYTDGLTEAKNAAGDEYGNDRLLEICTENHGASAHKLNMAIMSDLREFMEGHKLQDDMTGIIFKKNQVTISPEVQNEKFKRAI